MSKKKVPVKARDAEADVDERLRRIEDDMVVRFDALLRRMVDLQSRLVLLEESSKAKKPWWRW